MASNCSEHPARNASTLLSSSTTCSTTDVRGLAVHLCLASNVRCRLPPSSGPWLAVARMQETLSRLPRRGRNVVAHLAGLIQRQVANCGGATPAALGADAVGQRRRAVPHLRTHPASGVTALLAGQSTTTCGATRQLAVRTSKRRRSDSTKLPTVRLRPACSSANEALSCTRHQAQPDCYAWTAARHAVIPCLNSISNSVSSMHAGWLG